MEDSERINEGSRRRTESCGGSSDSELSEGWNIVDQALVFGDVNGLDVPSSDSESVEVIEAEDVLLETVLDTDLETKIEEESHLASKPVVLASEEDTETTKTPVLLVSQEDTETTETPVLLVSQEDTEATETPVDLVSQETLVGEADPPPAHNEVVQPVYEEMFDSSFCWFLFFTASAVLVSNVAFMATENAFNWNMEMSSESPSFLRDLPITQKPPPQDSLLNMNTWSDNEEITVDILDDLSVSQGDDVMAIPNNLVDISFDHSKHSNTVWQKQSLKIDKHEIGKYFKVLSEIAGSSEAQNKFAQALLILDALHIGMKDLEQVVTENSDLHSVLQKQRNNLFNTLNEIELGVSRSLEKLATNILNRVQKLERKFENQWCKLEKTGYKEELKGLFYDCLENEVPFKGSKDSDHTKSKQDFIVKKVKYLTTINARHLKGKTKNHFNKNNRGLYENDQHKQVTKDSYQFEIDKGSFSKVYNKPGAEDGESGERYKLLKSQKTSDEKQFNKHEKFNNLDHNKSPVKDENNINQAKVNKEKKKEKYSNDINQIPDKSRQISLKGEEKLSTKHPHQMKSKKITTNKLRNEVPQSKDEKVVTDKSAVEFAIKFLKDNCKNGRKIENLSEEYQSLKNQIDGQVNLPSEIFSKIYSKYCLNIGDNSKPKKPTSNKYQQYKHQTKYNKVIADKSALEMVTQYLKDNCKRLQIDLKATKENIYHTLKDALNKEVNIPSDVFNKMYERFCKSDDKFYKQDKLSKNQEKGEFSGRDKERHITGASHVIEDHKKFIKDVIEIKLIEESEDKEEQNGLGKNDVILESNKPRQWKFTYVSSSITNETDLNGNWFIKSGESRAKTRWSHHRGDWWFDRASYRQNNPLPQNWFTKRHKNWFFRRAWARQQCRESPNISWCNLNEDETISIPKASSKFR